MVNYQDDLQHIQTGEDSYEFHVDPSLMPQLRRMLLGTTPTDREIDALEIVPHPLWLNGIVRLLRWYRYHVSHRLGQRCVYEPSCSRYAEAAFRNYGFFRGLVRTLRRLLRCRPGYGGIDLP